MYSLTDATQSMLSRLSKRSLFMYKSTQLKMIQFHTFSFDYTPFCAWSSSRKRSFCSIMEPLCIKIKTGKDYGL